MKRPTSVTLGGGSGGGAASSITISTTTITGGTNTRVFFDDSGVIGESAGLVYAKATGTLTATVLNATGLTASRLAVTDASKNLASNGALVTNKIPKAASSGASLADSQISDDGTTVTVPDATVRTAGTGVATAKVVGVLNVDVTPVSTTDANEDVLMQYTLPQNTLSANGKGIRIRAAFTTSNNATANTYKLYFGSTVIQQPQAQSTANVATFMIADVFRTAAGAQIAASFCYVSVNTAGGSAVVAGVQTTTPAEDTTAAGGILIKGTGTKANPGTITQVLMVVEALN